MDDCYKAKTTNAFEILQVGRSGLRTEYMPGRNLSRNII